MQTLGATLTKYKVHGYKNVELGKTFNDMGPRSIFQKEFKLSGYSSPTTLTKSAQGSGSSSKQSNETPVTPSPPVSAGLPVRDPLPHFKGNNGVDYQLSPEKARPYVFHRGIPDEEELYFDNNGLLVCYAKWYSGGKTAYSNQLIDVFGQPEKPAKKLMDEISDESVFSSSPRSRLVSSYTFPTVLVSIQDEGSRTLVSVIDRKWVVELLNQNARTKRQCMKWMAKAVDHLPFNITVTKSSNPGFFTPTIYLQTSLAELNDLPGTTVKKATHIPSRGEPVFQGKPRIIAEWFDQDPDRKAAEAIARRRSESNPDVYEFSLDKPGLTAAYLQGPLEKTVVDTVYLSFRQNVLNKTVPLLGQDKESLFYGQGRHHPFNGRPFTNALEATPFWYLVIEMNVALLSEAFPPINKKVNYGHTSKTTRNELQPVKSYYSWRTEGDDEVKCWFDDTVTIETRRRRL